jgi:hypothetical protein
LTKALAPQAWALVFEGKNPGSLNLYKELIIASFKHLTTDKRERTKEKGQKSKKRRKKPIR